MAVGTSAYTGGCIEEHCNHHANLFPKPSEEAITAAAHLNNPFTEQEIQAGMKRLLNNKAAGVDGIVGEFLTQAYTNTQTQGRKLHTEERGKKREE